MMLEKLVGLRLVLVLIAGLGIAWLHWGIGISLSLVPMYGVLVLLLLFSWAVTRRQADATVTPLEIFAHLLTDLTAFAVLVFFSGGATNPFVALMLVPVVIGAISLGARFVWTLTAIAGGYYGVLLFNYRPLAIDDPAAAYGMHLGGMWFNFVISAALIAFFVTRMNRELRERERALSVLREKQLRDERVLALGTQAALAAHELATPLGSIAMTAGELAREYANDAEIGAECRVLQEQAAICRTLLDRLADRARSSEQGANVETAQAWLSAIVDRWKTIRPLTDVSLRILDELGATTVAPPDELEAALMNLFNNAADVSPAAVVIVATRQAQSIRIEIGDRGPGFSERARSLAGRVPFTGKPGRGLGLGMTLSYATVERLGGNVNLTERPGGGAWVAVTLPLSGMQCQ